MYKRNNEVRSRNYFCRGRGISITYYECVFVALGYTAFKEHETYYIVTCDLSGSTTFSRITSCVVFLYTFCLKHCSL